MAIGKKNPHLSLPLVSVTFLLRNVCFKALQPIFTLQASKALTTAQDRKACIFLEKSMEYVKPLNGFIIFLKKDKEHFRDKFRICRGDETLGTF